MTESNRKIDDVLFKLSVNHSLVDFDAQLHTQTCDAKSMCFNLAVTE